MFSILAYLDPGSGSIVVQTIIAGLVGFALAIKMFWRRIVGFFRFRKPASGESEAQGKVEAGPGNPPSGA